VTTWPRCDAECSPARGYYYHPSRHSAGQPIVAGWAYQWIAQLGFDRDSWTAPVDAARLHPLDDTDQTATGQVRALLDRLPTGGPAPLFVFDGGDDSAQLSLDLADAPAAVLVRLRSDRCFYTDPPPRPPGSTAPPRRQVQLRRPDHLADPDRHPGLPRRSVRHRERAGVERAASQPATSPRPRHSPTAADRARHRHPRPGRTGPRADPAAQGAVAVVVRPAGLQLDLDLAWRAYTRRFDLEHTVRFATQTLGWTIPRPATPSRPTARPGWCWPPTPSYAWPAPSPATSACRGSGPDPNRALAGNSTQGVEVRAMNTNGPHSRSLGCGAGPRRGAGAVGLGAAAGCVATADRAGVGPRDWSSPEHPKTTLNPSSRPTNRPECRFITS
jgi:hypothetical protein